MNIEGMDIHGPHITECATVDLYRAGSHPSDYDVEWTINYQRVLTLTEDGECESLEPEGIVSIHYFQSLDAPAESRTLADLSDEQRAAMDAAVKAQCAEQEADMIKRVSDAVCRYERARDESED